MSNQGSQIHPDGLLLCSCEKGGDFSSRSPAVSGNQRSNAHTNEIFGGRLLIDRLYMRVHIDEAGREYLTFRIDRPLPGLRKDPSNLSNTTVRDSHVTAEPRIATTVYDARVSNDEIESQRAKSASSDFRGTAEPGKHEQCR